MVAEDLGKGVCGVVDDAAGVGGIGTSVQKVEIWNVDGGNFVRNGLGGGWVKE